MTYTHYFDVPDAPENCLACQKPLTEKQMEDGYYYCNENCEKEWVTQVKAERDAEEAFAQQEVEQARRLVQEAQEAGFKDVEDYLISLQLPSPGRAPSPEEEYLGDLAFDADRERRVFGRRQASPS
jgi:uncharacterized Zn finger protein (UPF0148 family)